MFDNSGKQWVSFSKSWFALTAANLVFIGFCICYIAVHYGWLEVGK